MTEVRLNELVVVPESAYNADTTAVRKTWLDKIDRSPAHLRAYLDGQADDDTEDLAFGRLLHAFVLEPDSVASRYYRIPPCDLRTKAGKAIAEEAALANVGKLGFRDRDYDLGIKLRDAVYAHRGARTVLGCEGEFERSIFWDHADTGERCKARYDKVSVSKAFVADLKSTRDASPTAFAKAIVNYRYDVQADHYTEPTGLRFVLIAVEKTPPYAVAVYAASDEILERGARLRRPNMETYAECRASGKWPAYPETIQRIELPRWAR